MEGYATNIRNFFAKRTTLTKGHCIGCKVKHHALYKKAHLNGQAKID